MFEDTPSGNPSPTDDDTSNPAEWALDQILYEINDIAKATLGAMTLSTMLKQIEPCKNINNSDFD
ncbi:MAG: hypothetical protein GY761_03715 [Hyphomicrobiales bacterium]|nr:hypothetical protein [Hyphomicrobiales bacterium]